MASNKIKVVGYAQKVVYTDGIEYRNFSPDLAGFQLASHGGTPLFTMGNFAITTNLDPKLDKFYNSSSFSNFITLTDLNLTVSDVQELLANNAEVVLNLDKTNLDYYALFGSLNEFIRVALENIIINWPASLYLYPVSQNLNGQPISGTTFDSYTYDEINNVSTFRVNTTYINNKFQIIYTKNGSILNTFNSSNDLRNLTANYNSYVVYYDGVEFPILNYTASTYSTMDYAYYSVQGNPFSGVSEYTPYHIKPNKLISDTFFNGLSEFESFLLNRSVVPLYTATFRYPVKSDSGLILYISKSLTWPVSDGYNIDYDTTSYEDYAGSLSEIAAANDLFSSNLMGRFLVSESITSFDTSPVVFSSEDQDTSGKKVNKLLQIYGVEFDKINRYITGIQFANTVTYDKEDNTPDAYLKNIARVLGWDLISSVVENDLLASYVTTSQSTYSGQSVGLTAVEADIELWRRLILNTPWIWKSKGSRKSIEFLLNFIGAPSGLFSFNEYIYKAAAPLDINLFQKVLTLNGLSDDISIYPIDSDGYPKPLPNTPDMYFQNDGLWYRETGGSGATIDILYGNNPHMGPYDAGFKYINQFKNLIKDFSAVTVSSVTTTTSSENLYTNYDLGSFDFGVSTATTITTVDFIDETNSLHDCIVFTPKIEVNPNPTQLVNDCGCDTTSSNNILSLCIDTRPARDKTPCTNLHSHSLDPTTGLIIFGYKQFNINGTLFTNNGVTPILNTTNFTQQACCKALGGTPFLYDEVINDSVNQGYVCCAALGNKCGCTLACKWKANITPLYLPINGNTQSPYIQFTKPSGLPAIVTPDGCNCIPTYSTPVPNILDPYTGQIGYGCRLTSTGLNDLNTLGNNGVIYKYYMDRSLGITPCS